jgi:hypothetical protein
MAFVIFFNYNISQLSSLIQGIDITKGRHITFLSEVLRSLRDFRDNIIKGDLERSLACDDIEIHESVVDLRSAVEHEYASGT